MGGPTPGLPARRPPAASDSCTEGRSDHPTRGLAGTWSTDGRNRTLSDGVGDRLATMSSSVGGGVQGQGARVSTAEQGIAAGGPPAVTGRTTQKEGPWGN